MTDTGTAAGASEVLSSVSERIQRVVDRVVDATRGQEVPAVAGTVDDVREVVEELAEFVAAVDVTEGAKALEVPEDPDSARDLVDVPELHGRVDIRDLWREFRELRAEIEELRGDGADEDTSTEGDTDPRADDVDPTELELALKSAVEDAVERFREEILDARERLTEAVEDIDDRTVDDPDSRNPSAFSTLPGSRTDMGGVARGSTVPRETRHSTTPNYRRIYGSRFEDAGGDEGE